MIADNDFNVIKPVESLQNVTGLTSIKHHEGKKRRQYPDKKNKEESEDKADKSAEGRLLDDDVTEGKNTPDSDGNRIDYCA